MSTYARQIRLPSLMVALALSWGCATKQRPTAPAPPPPAEAATPEPTPTPSPTPQQTQTEQQAQTPGQGTPPPEPAPSPTPANPEKKTKVAKQRPAPKKSPTPAAPTQTAKNNPPKKIPDPDLASGQISPADNAITRGEPTTEQLLESTENSLNSLKRQLSVEEQARVTEIHDYIDRSRQATKDNDAARAHNLAIKAHQECDDLVNRK